MRYVSFLGYFFDISVASDSPSKNWVLDSTAARWPYAALPELNVHINLHAFHMTTNVLFMSNGGNSVRQTSLKISAIRCCLANRQTVHTWMNMTWSFSESYDSV